MAVVAWGLQALASSFGPVFSEYARASGLALNHRKTAFVPLCDQTSDDLRAWLDRACPGWGAAPICLQAAYVGFVLGPEAGTTSWDRARDKVDKRAR